MRKPSVIRVLAIVSILVFTTANKPESPRVAVIGTGLAGMSAAYYLKKLGMDVEIFEAASLVGGVTKQTKYHDLQLENGGCFINSDHTFYIDLLKELRISRLDRFKQGAEAAVVRKYFGGRFLSDDPKVIFAENKEAILALNRMGKEPDTKIYPNISTALKNANVGPELAAWIEVGINAEYGSSLDETAASILWDVLKIDIPNQTCEVGAQGDGRYFILGGTAAVFQGLVSGIGLSGNIHLQHELRAISQTPTGDYHVTFDSPNGQVVRQFPKVVVAIPLPVLANPERPVAIAPRLLNKNVEAAMKETKYGRNQKLFLAYDKKFWDFDDLFIEGSCIWDQMDLEQTWGRVSRSWQGSLWRTMDGLLGREVVPPLHGLTVYVGGNNIERLKDTEAYIAYIHSVFQRMYPDVDVQAAFKGYHVGNAYHDSPFQLGSYAGYNPAGKSNKDMHWEALKPVLQGKGLVFAGSSWTMDTEEDKVVRGFMEGAVRSGKLAAEALRHASNL